MTTTRQAWIHSARFDTAFIIAPAFIVSLVVLCAPGLFALANDLPLAWWVALVLCIDVAHVYSTLFRSYLDPMERKERAGLLLIVPITCWLLGAVLYAIGSATFWSVLAYLAVFHFIRQQYGFFMIYSRIDPDEGRWAKRLDKVAIYLATIYPLTFWHTHLPRNFEWFVEGDFVAIRLQELSALIGSMYLIVIGLYAAKELRLWRRTEHLNVPKQAFLLGTALSWYVGIVLCNGDMAFTLTNVVAHGVPYMALVWSFGRKRWAHTRTENTAPLLRWLLSLRAVPAFVTLLIVLAYLEEALWDALVWRDRGSLFGEWYLLPQIGDSDILVWLVPLLAVPQATHYVLDGFLWRMRRPAEGVQELLGE